MEQLKKVFGDVLGVNAGQIGPAFSPLNCPAWDSFHHVVLIIALQKEFGIKLTMKEAMAIDTYQTAFELISKKTSKVKI
jgi:acyl carrier protein